MVTLIKYGALSGGEKYNVNVLELDGLSTDTKPTVTFVEYGSDGREVGRMAIPNGSKYNEVDTGKEFRYDAENATWYESSSGGGGGGGTTNYAALTNKPSINNTTLIGNKTSSDLGLQSTIDSTHKLSADNVDDTNSTNKFATAAQLTQIATNESNISSLANHFTFSANSGHYYLQPEEPTNPQEGDIWIG